MTYINRQSYYGQKRLHVSQIPPQEKHKTFDATAYLTNEFFNADNVTFTKITRFYKQLYGNGAYKYLMDTFNSWKFGYVRPSGQTIGRILECVPKFLTDEKRFHILKCEIIKFIDNQHHKQRHKHIAIDELERVFDNYAKEIHNFTQLNLTWFVRREIFTDAEIEQFLTVCKYALQEKLNLSYRQVRNDLELVSLKLLPLKPGTFTATYYIDFLSCYIDLPQLNYRAQNPIQFRNVGIRIEGKFKRFAEEYILQELMKMSFSEKEGQINHFIKANDLEFFIAQYREILDKDTDADLSSQFKGEGGQLSLSLRLYSLSGLRISVALSVAKLLLYSGIVTAATFVVMRFQLYKILVLLVWGGLMVGAAVLSGMNTELRTLRKLSLDLKRHGL
jgi:hypothetical protein